jgi:uncharacterized membrane protein
MSELKFALEEHRGRIDLLTTWLPRVAVALAFLSIGADKFAPHSQWVRIFDRIGFEQWLRYLTGTLQIAGALMVLIPRTFLIGILILACTMVGAMAVWIFLLGLPGNALIPGIVFGALVAVGAQSLRRP